MAMKEYSTLPRAPETKPHHQMQFNDINKTPYFVRWYLAFLKKIQY